MRSQYCCEVATEKEESIAHKADSTFILLRRKAIANVLHSQLEASVLKLTLLI